MSLSVFSAQGKQGTEATMAENQRICADKECERLVGHGFYYGDGTLCFNCRLESFTQQIYGKSAKELGVDGIKEREE